MTRRFLSMQDIAVFLIRLLDIKGRVAQDPRNVKPVAAYPIGIAWPGRSFDRATQGSCLVRIHKTTALRLEYGRKKLIESCTAPDL